MSASGDNTIIGTNADEHLNGGSGNDTVSGGGGNDFVNGGSGNDILNGGAGSDRVDGDSGNDLLIYNASENVGTTDIYDGGSGIDTLRLDLTSAQWLSVGVQHDVANYLQFVADNTLPNGQAKNAEFQFHVVRSARVEGRAAGCHGRRRRGRSEQSCPGRARGYQWRRCG